MTASRMNPSPVLVMKWAFRLASALICVLFAAQMWSGVPGPDDFSAALGVPVVPAAGETNQYIVQAQRGSVDFRRIGSVHLDLGYTVGVTLHDGTPIGFRFEPPAAPLGARAQRDAMTVPTAEQLAASLGVPVEAAVGELNQFVVRAGKGSVDLTKVGVVHLERGDSVGITLPNGAQIGIRFKPTF